MDLPEGLDWVRGSPAGRAWLAALPTWLAECAERWSLRLGPPFRYAYASLALPADLPDGTAAVLKLQYPDEESRHEADALAHWDGDGAIRLLAHDPGRRALLVERCQPGTPLHDLPLDRGAGRGDRAAPPALATGRRAVHPAGRGGRRLDRPDARDWERAGRPYERRLLDAALDLLAGLVVEPGRAGAGQPGPARRQHARRRPGEPWLVIDPKPLTGEREFTVVPMVRGPELGHSPGAVRHRLDRLSAELGLDRERVPGLDDRAHAGLERRRRQRLPPTRSRWSAGCSTPTEPWPGVPGTGRGGGGSALAGGAPVEVAAGQRAPADRCRRPGRAGRGGGRRTPRRRAGPPAPARPIASGRCASRTVSIRPCSTAGRISPPGRPRARPAGPGSSCRPGIVGGRPARNSASVTKIRPVPATTDWSSSSAASGVGLRRDPARTPAPGRRRRAAGRRRAGRAAPPPRAG